jgi:ribonuclease G
MGKWEQIHNQLVNATQPAKLLSELDKTSSILRDILNDSFNRIVINDKELYSSIKGYLGNIAPDQQKIINLHRGRKSIFETFGVNRQIKSSFGKTATMGSGAYLVIESTEAMHVVDVNSGPKMQRKDQETSALAVNLEAAEEIARQLRLRDIGGLIIIDFIDMRSGENRSALIREMRKFMKKDRAQHTILPLSKFGLMQITRQRVKPEVKIDTSEVCPVCEGSGKINPTLLLTDQIERDIEYIFSSRPNVKIELQVHPFVCAFIKSGFPSLQHKWYFKHMKWIKVKTNQDLNLVTYKFFDKNNDEIRLN